MIRIVGVIAAAMLTVPASGQTTIGSVGMNSPNYSTYQSSIDGLGHFGSPETPTMRARKLDQAIALRIEAATLLKQDGGKFTPAHEAYIRDKACGFLGAGRTSIGSLVPRRRCGS